MRYVILPQALYNMMPSMLSQFVSTIKETTLGYVINVPELTFAANQINNRLLTKPFEVFFILAVIYFVVCWSLTQLANWLERRIAREAGRQGRHTPRQSATAHLWQRSHDHGRRQPAEQPNMIEFIHVNKWYGDYQRAGRHQRRRAARARSSWSAARRARASPP